MTRAETPRQAQRWDIVKSRYLNAGLCHRCAAQAAWGHQANGKGWAALRPPCDACQSLIQSFPMPTTTPLWRKYPHPQVLEKAAAPVTPLNAVEDTYGLAAGPEGGS